MFYIDFNGIKVGGIIKKPSKNKKVWKNLLGSSVCSIPRLQKFRKTKTANEVRFLVVKYEVTLSDKL